MDNNEKDRIIDQINAVVATWPQELQDKAARILAEADPSDYEEDYEYADNYLRAVFDGSAPAESPHITRAKARYDDPEPLTLTLSHGQMACLRGIVQHKGDELLEQGHTESTSGYLQIVLGIEYLIEEASGWPEEDH